MTLKRVKGDPIPKRIWNKVVDFFAHFENHITNKTEASDESKIRRYIDDLGPAGNAGESADFISVCYDSLRGNGDQALQRQVLNTIAWREERITLIQTLLKSLHHEGHLHSIVKRKKGFKAGSRKHNQASVEVRHRLCAIPSARRLLRPLDNDKIPI